MGGSASVYRTRKRKKLNFSSRKHRRQDLGRLLRKRKAREGKENTDKDRGGKKKYKNDGFALKIVDYWCRSSSNRRLAINR